MIREEARQAAHEYIQLILKETFYVDYVDIKEAFLAGAKWADTHTINIWHDVSEEPKIGFNIVVINKTGRLWNIRTHDDDYDWLDIKDWVCFVHTYDIQKWAYINDLLPK